ncbi:response regulator transcription factor [Guyparkeria hydrothermalis]|uniref:response regulator transcription factor n=1 Tax=Guyparkeria hydrothermalis TaxID=923 RepID=UPI0020227839|nr:response regulator transcription factor [Guyparkeria hydrothermalis]MCL7743698.1 response regulator transcription factor [Guyparkeria hydrothermalis]
MVNETKHGPAQLRILIVDDERDEIEELEEHFGNHGIPSVGVTSADEARTEFLENAEIAVLLVDIGMPGEDGVSFIDWATRHYEGDRVFEAAIFSGYRSREKALDAMRAGARDYFEKPVDLDELVIAMKDALERVARRRERMAFNRHSLPMDALDGSLSEIRAELSELRESIGSRRESGEPTAELADDLKDIQARMDRLTKRQKEVTQLVAGGHSNYQIACELGISENTVKLYVSQILDTLGVSNRTQIALLAHRLQQAAS